jgi:hypothetical protein
VRLPKFTARSDQPAWKQVVKALAFFAVVSAVLAGSLALGGWGLGKWHDHQNARAERSAIAALGLRRICSGNVDSGCMQRAADVAKVPVVTAPTSYADLLVSTGSPAPGAVAGLAPVPPRATQVRYAAFEQVWAAPSTVALELVTAPTSRPAHTHSSTASVTVAGVTVDVRAVEHESCDGCGIPVRDVWAEWDHTGHRYAAWFVLLADQGTPAKFLAKLLPTLSYTAPQR